MWLFGFSRLFRVVFALATYWPKTSWTDSVFILSLFSPWLKELSYLTVRQLSLCKVDLDLTLGLCLYFLCLHSQHAFTLNGHFLCNWKREGRCHVIFVVRTIQFSSVQSLSHVRLFATTWIAACQASLSITSSRSSLRVSSIESVMPSSHLILCRPLLLLPLIPPNIKVFSNESTLRMRWPKY